MQTENKTFSFWNCTMGARTMGTIANETKTRRVSKDKIKLFHYFNCLKKLFWAKKNRNKNKNREHWIRWCYRRLCRRHRAALSHIFSFLSSDRTHKSTKKIFGISLFFSAKVSFLRFILFVLDDKFSARRPSDRRIFIFGYFGICYGRNCSDG